MSGIPVNFKECPYLKKCPCGICAVCGFRKHVSLHGPYTKGDVEVFEPWGHEFRPRPPLSAKQASVIRRRPR